MSAPLSRRTFLTTTAAAAVFTGVSSPGLAQQSGDTGRTLVTPRQFVQLLDAAKAGPNPVKDFFDVQRNYEVAGTGNEFTAEIRVIVREKVERIVKVDLNADNLGRIDASPEKGYFMNGLPTLAFITDIHQEAYRFNAGDPRKPQPNDRLNYETRTRLQVMLDVLRDKHGAAYINERISAARGGNTAARNELETLLEQRGLKEESYELVEYLMTHEELLKHLRDAHSLSGEDMANAVKRAVSIIRSLEPDRLYASAAPDGRVNPKFAAALVHPPIELG